MESLFQSYIPGAECSMTNDAKFEEMDPVCVEKSGNRVRLWYSALVTNLMGK